MSSEVLDRRIWQLFKHRFHRKAQSPSAQEQISGQLAGKVAGLERREQKFMNLRRVVREASDLWANRSNLRKRDVVYLAAALLYFISPFDAIPDMIPGAGYVDDLVVLSAIVGTIARGISSLGSRGKERLEEWIDERTEIAFERLDESAANGVQKTIAAVVIGLWGMTTAAAISLSVATALGHYPSEWITYVVLTTALIAACNLTTGVYYWRRYRRLDGKWQKRLAELVTSKFSWPHAVAIGLPILALIGLGVGRALGGWF